ncbi:MAG: hypothetical protein ACPGU2_06620, partial [Candidatus Puniceispirillaceae bacterium]
MSDRLQAMKFCMKESLCHFLQCSGRGIGIFLTGNNTDRCFYSGNIVPPVEVYKTAQNIPPDK